MQSIKIKINAVKSTMSKMSKFQMKARLVLLIFHFAPNSRTVWHGTAVYNSSLTDSLEI